jgi:hypothetical protein
MSRRDHRAAGTNGRCRRYVEAERRAGQLLRQMEKNKGGGD